jgi:hypothetical protein
MICLFTILALPVILQLLLNVCDPLRGFPTMNGQELFIMVSLSLIPRIFKPSSPSITINDELTCSFSTFATKDGNLHKQAHCHLSNRS